MTSVNIPTLHASASFPAYVAKPAGVPRGAIIVIQEIFGVNAGIRKKCDYWAAAGYLAVAPDIFWRINAATDLDPDVPEQFAKALDLMGKFDQPQGVRDIEAAIRWAREQEEDLGVREPLRVGCVGFCLGGRLAYMVAAATDIDASVGYYAVGIDGLFDDADFGIAGINRPLMLHIPTKDGFVPPETQAAMHARLDDHPLVTLYDYDGLDHGFADTFGARRDDAAARLADDRTAAFFADHIG